MASVTPKLLVVEDDELMAQLIVSISNSAGFEVALTDGEHAAAGYAELRPEVIVLDILMPKVDGIELLRWLKDTDCKARIVLLSGDAGCLQMAESIAGDALCIAASIGKPFALDEVRGVLRRLHDELTRSMVA